MGGTKTIALISTIVREQLPPIAETVTFITGFALPEALLHIIEPGVKRMSIKKLQEKKTGMNYLMISISMLLCSLAVNAHAEGCGGTVIYEGKRAGQVVFDRTLHVSKGLTCSDCHEGKAFSFALFEMKKGANMLSMRNMELGRSCGYCHDGKKAFSTTNSLHCSKCHLKG